MSVRERVRHRPLMVTLALAALDQTIEVADADAAAGTPATAALESEPR